MLLQDPGGGSHMEWTGMLVVSLRGVNFGFRLGCSGLVNSCTRRNNKTERIVVLLGVKFKISDWHPRPLHMGVPPPGLEDSEAGR